MKNLLNFLLALLMLVSCSEESSDESETNSFTRIYDNNLFSYSFAPVDVMQTSDGGYIVLALRFTPEVSMGGVHLLKADKSGNFLRDIPLDETLANPLPGMTFQDGKIHFVCMDFSSQTKIVSLDENLDNIAIADVPLSYPAAATYIDNEYLILSYDQVEMKTGFSRVSLAGNVITSRYFMVSDDDSMEDEIIKHFLRTGKRFPFLAGKTSSGRYYFNGFYNYTFSLVFTGLTTDDDVRGVVQGQQDHGGFSSITPIDGGKFAVSYFHYDDNYIMPNVSLETDETTSIADFTGFDMREFASNTGIQISSATLKGKKVTMYASNTHSKQIGLFLYDESSGEFLGSRYFGFTNPYEFGRMVVTSDGGLVLAGTTYIAGRFSRICLIKISAEEFNSIIRK
jgi:hypothetical protein